jgi:hypothetical protein
VIDMTDDALEDFLAEDPGGPVVMLDLLRYVPDTGRADYLAHIAHTRPSAAATAPNRCSPPATDSSAATPR